MNAAQRRTLRRTRSTQQIATSTTASAGPPAVRKPSVFTARWLKWLLGTVFAAVLALFADMLVRPLIAKLLPAPIVKVTVYRWNPEVSSLPCTHYTLIVDPPEGENIEGISLGVEFPKPVKDLALDGTWHTGEAGVQLMGATVVLPGGPHGCHFGPGTQAQALPPNIKTNMTPPPANKFLLDATDVHEPIRGKFIVQENPGQKEVIVSGEYQYSRVGVPRKKPFEVSTKTVSVK